MTSDPGRDQRPEGRIGSLWGPLGSLWEPRAAPGDLRGPVGDDFQAAVDSYFRCSPRGSRFVLLSFLGGFWHKVFGLSRRVASRLKNDENM